MFLAMGLETERPTPDGFFPNPLEEERADRERRREVGRWLLFGPVTAPILWWLGYPRFAVAGLALAFTLWSTCWGRGERRLPPGEPGRPVRVATPAGATAGLVGLGVAAVVMLPTPEYTVLIAVFAVTLAALWLRTRRWRRADSPPF